MSTYDIRWYRPADRAQFLDLYADVLDTWRHSPEWFDWKYVSNPYVDHVPIVVATTEGDLVGARSFFALPMVVDGARCDALQPCDTMVAPDHRRRGLFTRMTERAIDRYEESDHEFFFNFPNEWTRRGNRKLGWRRVGTVPLAYRVEDATPLLATRTRVPGHRMVGAAATRLLSEYNRRRTAPPDRAADITVRHEETVPIEQVADIYGDAVPETIHAHRDPSFYRWRLSNPDWNYTAVLAADGAGSAAAVIVARTPPGNVYGPSVTRIADVVPLAAGDHRDPLLNAVLSAVRATFSESDLFVAPTTVPDSVLRAQGFHREDEPPLSLVCSPRPHLVRALDTWKPAGQQLTDSDNWTTTFVELDTG